MYCNLEGHKVGRLHVHSRYHEMMWAVMWSTLHSPHPTARRSPHRLLLEWMFPYLLRFYNSHSPAPHKQVDLNLLVDWNWPAFLYDLPAFVAAVPSPSDLTDLLFAMRPGNMCEEGGLYVGIPVKPSAASPQVR